MSLPRPAGLTVRPAQPGDVGLLLELIRSAFAQYRGMLDPPSSAERKTVAVVAVELESGAAFVAEVDRLPVGCVFLRDRNGKAYWDRLSVLPAMRGRGIGRALIGHVESEAINRGFRTARLEVRVQLQENHRFYESMDYHVVGYGSHRGYTAPTFQIMEKELVDE